MYNLIILHTLLDKYLGELSQTGNRQKANVKLPTLKTEEYHLQENVSHLILFAWMTSVEYCYLR